jgi:hypothetical protein
MWGWGCLIGDKGIGKKWHFFKNLPVNGLMYIFEWMCFCKRTLIACNPKIFW